MGGFAYGSKVIDILRTKRFTIRTQGVGMNVREWRDYFCLFTAENNS